MLEVQMGRTKDEVSGDVDVTPQHTSIRELRRLEDKRIRAQFGKETASAAKTKNDEVQLAA